MDVKIAVCQKPPVLLDLEATMERALETLDEAVDEGAQLIVFPEAYVPGYPSWIWRARVFCLEATATVGSMMHPNRAVPVAPRAREGHASPLCVPWKLHSMEFAEPVGTLFDES